MREMLFLFYMEKLRARLESFIQAGGDKERQEAYLAGLQEGLILGLEERARGHETGR